MNSVASSSEPVEAGIGWRVADAAAAQGPAPVPGVAVVDGSLAPPPSPRGPLPYRLATPARFGHRLGRLGAHAWRGQRTIRDEFPALDATARTRRIRDWSAELVQRCGIELQVSGVPPTEPALVAANHVSWLDIFAINAARPVRFVSKAEAASWPLIGPLVRGVGTLLIERERAHDVVRVIREMAQSLQGGDAVGVFPEGTTTPGHALLPFHANLFQAACAADVPVQPVLLFYADARSGRFSRAAAYVGDETMLGSLWRLSAAPRLRIEVEFLAPIRSVSRRALARDARDAIAERLDARLRDAS
jgi:1-acyl-sn-glycerol-3-phosphate acyltransferase